MNKTFLAFSCTHAPLHDPQAIDWLLGRISDLKPDVIIHLGDLCEAEGATKFPSHASWTLEDEFISANELLVEIQDHALNAEYVFLEGNHTDNIKSPDRIPQQLISLCDPYRNIPALKHWKCLPYIHCRKQGTYRLGQVSFSHGYEAGMGGDKAQSVLLGDPYGLYVGGHTHRPRPVTQFTATAAIPIPYWYANTGCLRHLKPPYMQRKRTHLWGHGIVTGEAAMIKSPRLSRMWRAETEIFQMYDEWVAGGGMKRGKYASKKLGGSAI